MSVFLGKSEGYNEDKKLPLLKSIEETLLAESNLIISIAIWVYHSISQFFKLFQIQI